MMQVHTHTHTHTWAFESCPRGIFLTSIFMVDMADLNMSSLQQQNETEANSKRHARYSQSLPESWIARLREPVQIFSQFCSFSA